MEQLQLKDRNWKTLHDVLELLRDKIVHDVLEPDMYHLSPITDRCSANTQVSSDLSLGKFAFLQ